MRIVGCALLPVLCVTSSITIVINFYHLKSAVAKYFEYIPISIAQTEELSIVASRLASPSAWSFPSMFLWPRTQRILTLHMSFRLFCASLHCSASLERGCYQVNNFNDYFAAGLPLWLGWKANSKVPLNIRHAGSSRIFHLGCYYGCRVSLHNIHT